MGSNGDFDNSMIMTTSVWLNLCNACQFCCILVTEYTRFLGSKFILTIIKCIRVVTQIITNAGLTFTHECTPSDNWFTSRVGCILFSFVTAVLWYFKVKIYGKVIYNCKFHLIFNSADLNAFKKQICVSLSFMITTKQSIQMFWFLFLFELEAI